MALPNCGAAPRYLENLRIGGGYGTAPNGGADLDAAGNAAFNGDLTVAGDFLALGPLRYRDALRADTANGGVNRDWSVAPELFGDGSNSTLAGSVAVNHSSRMHFAAWPFPPNTLEAVNCSFMLPPDYDGSPLRVRLVWVSEAALGGTGGDVVWRVYMTAYTDGETFNISTTSVDAIDSFQAVDTFHIIDLNYTLDTYGPGQPVALNLRRDGASGLDTFDADAQLIKVLISYA